MFQIQPLGGSQAELPPIAAFPALCRIAAVQNTKNSLKYAKLRERMQAISDDPLIDIDS